MKEKYLPQTSRGQDGVSSNKLPQTSRGQCHVSSNKLPLPRLLLQRLCASLVIGCYSYSGCVQVLL